MMYICDIKYIHICGYRMRIGTTNLHMIVMGLFPVAICTLAMFSMTSRREDGGEGWSCGAQHISWNCVTVIDSAAMSPWNVRMSKNLFQ